MKRKVRCDRCRRHEKEAGLLRWVSRQKCCESCITTHGGARSRTSGERRIDLVGPSEVAFPLPHYGGKQGWTYVGNGGRVRAPLHATD